VPDNILFMVEYGNAHAIVWASGREEAKRQAQAWLPHHAADLYTVTPLTAPGDRVKLMVTLAI